MSKQPAANADTPSSADLAGKTALITGGARGIGAAAGLALARRGTRIHLADLLCADEAVSDIEAAGGHAESHVLDVRDAGACKTLVETILDTDTALDILVCNAGVCPPGSIHGDTAQWQTVVDVNLNGTQNCVAACWDDMLSRRSGRIVIVSSMAYYRGGLIVGTEYTASKAALIGMTRHLARNGGPYGILCNAVAPGIIDTEMTRDFDKPDTDDIPLRRYGTAEDVAGPISFLCGPESAYMTGTVLNVTGGMVLAA